MRILHANTLYPPFAEGGTESVIKETLTALMAAGHDVALVTTQPTKPRAGAWELFTTGGVRTYRFRPQNIYYYTEGGKKAIAQKLAWHGIDTANQYSARVLRAILEEEKPDLVHGHNLKGMSYTLPRVCATLGIPYVHTLHNYQLLHPFGTFTLRERPPYFQPKVLAQAYQAWNKKMFLRVAGVISPTSLPVQLHKKVGFFQASKLAYIPSPVRSIVAPHNVGSGLRLAYFGALEEIKGIRSLLEAVVRLPQQGWTLDIFGRGSLEKEMRVLGGSNRNIHWLGYVADASILSKYDALVYPSICWETQGLAMVEALTQGTPVIAANIGSIPETIQDKKNGLLFPSGNVAALTLLLAGLIAQPEKITRMRAAAKISATRYSVDQYLGALLEFYAQCSAPKNLT